MQEITAAATLEAMGARHWYSISGGFLDGDHMTARPALVDTGDFGGDQLTGKRAFDKNHPTVVSPGDPRSIPRGCGNS